MNSTDGMRIFITREIERLKRLLEDIDRVEAARLKRELPPAMVDAVLGEGGHV